MNSADIPSGDKQKPKKREATPLGIPPIVIPSEGDGLTDGEREKISAALQSGEAQRLASRTTVKLDAVDTDVRAQLHTQREQQTPRTLPRSPKGIVLGGTLEWYAKRLEIDADELSDLVETDYERFLELLDEKKMRITVKPEDL